MLDFGKRSKKLRQKAMLTQEAVAEHLGVTVQAISKWERGGGYPDITMLPVLARFYGISTDELLGMKKQISQKEKEAIQMQWEQNRKKGHHEKNVSLMKTAVQQWPDEWIFQILLSASLERLEGSDIERRMYLTESIRIQEQLLSKIDIPEAHCAVLFNLADSYRRVGDIKKAYSYAALLPNLYKTRENALVCITSDQRERKEIAEKAIEALLWSLKLHVQVLSESGCFHDKKQLTRIYDTLEDLSYLLKVKDNGKNP